MPTAVPTSHPAAVTRPSTDLLTHQASLSTPLPTSLHCTLPPPGPCPSLSPPRGLTGASGPVVLGKAILSQLPPGPGCVTEGQGHGSDRCSGCDARRRAPPQPAARPGPVGSRQADDPRDGRSSRLLCPGDRAGADICAGTLAAPLPVTARLCPLPASLAARPESSLRAWPEGCLQPQPHPPQSCLSRLGCRRDGLRETHTPWRQPACGVLPGPGPGQGDQLREAAGSAEAKLATESVSTGPILLDQGCGQWPVAPAPEDSPTLLMGVGSLWP